MVQRTWIAHLDFMQKYILEFTVFLYGTYSVFIILFICTSLVNHLPSYAF